MRRAVVAIIALVCGASGLAAGQSLQIVVLPTHGAIADQSYTLPLAAIGGIAPYTWEIAGGELPSGLNLHRHSGRIFGTPTATGEYRFTVEVLDSSIPKLHIQREMTIHVVTGLAVDWKEPPEVHGSAIAGSTVITNETPEDFVLTVIVVAVNETGRATALGYQHFKLGPESTSPVIPFSSSPGLGTYYVRVDAVAHRPGVHHFFRAAKQSTEPLKVTHF
jgi:hypothetical protein